MSSERCAYGFLSFSVFFSARDQSEDEELTITHRLSPALCRGGDRRRVPHRRDDVAHRAAHARLRFDPARPNVSGDKRASFPDLSASPSRVATPGTGASRVPPPRSSPPSPPSRPSHRAPPGRARRRERGVQTRDARRRRVARAEHVAERGGGSPPPRRRRRRSSARTTRASRSRWATARASRVSRVASSTRRSAETRTRATSECRALRGVCALLGVAPEAAREPPASSPAGSPVF